MNTSEEPLGTSSTRNAGVDSRFAPGTDVSMDTSGEEATTTLGTTVLPPGDTGTLVTVVVAAVEEVEVEVEVEEEEVEVEEELVLLALLTASTAGADCMINVVFSYKRARERL